MMGAPPCLDGLRNGRIAAAPVPLIGDERVSRYLRRTARRLPGCIPNSRQVTATDAIYTTVKGRGFPETTEERQTSMSHAQFVAERTHV